MRVSGGGRWGDSRRQGRRRQRGPKAARTAAVRQCGAASGRQRPGMGACGTRSQGAGCAAPRLPREGRRDAPACRRRDGTPRPTDAQHNPRYRVAPRGGLPGAIAESRTAGRPAAVEFPWPAPHASPAGTGGSFLLCSAGGVEGTCPPGGTPWRAGAPDNAGYVCAAVRLGGPPRAGRVGTGGRAGIARQDAGQCRPPRYPGSSGAGNVG